MEWVSGIYGPLTKYGKSEMKYLLADGQKKRKTGHLADKGSKI